MASKSSDIKKRRDKPLQINYLDISLLTHSSTLWKCLFNQSSIIFNKRKRPFYYEIMTTTMMMLMIESLMMTLVSSKLKKLHLQDLWDCARAVLRPETPQALPKTRRSNQLLFGQWQCIKDMGTMVHLF